MNREKRKNARYGEIQLELEIVGSMGYRRKGYIELCAVKVRGACTVKRRYARSAHELIS